jgi:chromosome segregation ATPase
LLTAIDQRDKEKFEDLHKSISACDDVLNSVETNLTSFQDDLAAVSAEIETLQARSTALSVRLENRKMVEHGLGPIVEEISVSPAVVRKIVDGAIDEAWVRALAEVEKRSKAMDAKSKELRNIKGINDLKPLLENLIAKVSVLVQSIRIILIIGRLLSASEISSLPRSKLYAPRTLMLKSYSSSTSFDTKTCSHSCIGITQNWPRRLARPT